VRETRHFASYLDGIIFSLAAYPSSSLVSRIIFARLNATSQADRPQGVLVGRGGDSAYLPRNVSFQQNTLDRARSLSF